MTEGSDLRFPSPPGRRLSAVGNAAAQWSPGDMVSALRGRIARPQDLLIDGDTRNPCKDHA